ncbi:hypothetical protein L2E82_26707 [Cichorium intybus]|uniref:Uncharacterized protein n=1 Tax=Cichorium intybus TaxID=13427 RepID=A0ACB9CRB7_CICIN|nr:hypothetical protein L2E82_26707 [Cichorium intybus]
MKVISVSTRAIPSIYSEFAIILKKGIRGSVEAKSDSLLNSSPRRQDPKVLLLAPDSNFNGYDFNSCVC